MSPKENLIELLRELFQLNNSDLDFGIYRILKLRSRDVEEFIDYVLPKKLEEVKKKLEDRAADDIKKELENVTTDLKANYGDDFETKTDALGQIALFKEKYGQYKLLRQNLENSRLSEDIENDIYNDLYRFFERYYEEGDFVTKPRAGDKTYMIPYDGEEVKLYWANYDQYYIKTGENFKNYVFTNGKENDDKITVEFRLKDVETTVNNNQNEKGRLFIPTEEYFEWNEEEKKLNIYFYYKKPTDKEKDDWGNKQSVKKDNKGINEQLILRLEKKIKGTKNKDLIEFYYEEREDKKLFAYHLNRYTALNKFDYFIHKDLKKFLTRELDYYLKNEILSISFLNPEWKDEDVEQGIKLNVVKASAIRELSYTIIEFLDELENFQRRLFEKKKFVVQNEYIMTLDMVPEEVIDDVIKDILEDEGKKQINEWIELEYLENDEINEEQLKNNKKLVIDTKCLTQEIKEALLNKLDRIENKTSGLLINSENLQALNFLLKKYKDRIQCTYLDPPYNTGDDVNFAYKDRYAESSWITLMIERLAALKVLLRENGTVAISIDINEVDKTLMMLDNLLGQENRKGIITIRRSSVSGAKVINPGIVNISEYVVIYSIVPNNWYSNKVFREKKRDERYNSFIKNFDESYEKWEYTSLLEAFADKMEIPKSKLKKKLGDDYEDELEKFIDDNYKAIFQFAYLDDKSISEEAVKMKYISKKDPSKTYRLEREDKNDYYIYKGKIILFYSDRLIELDGKKVFGELISDIWEDVLPNDIHNEGGVKLRKGKKPEKLVGRIIELATREEDYVIDAFAGSGTTGGVATKQNRRFINIEMADYFESLTLPRLKNTLYGEKSGLSSQYSWQGSGIINYVKLEQYEDTLNNIVFDENDLELEFEDKIKYRFRDGAENSASIMMVDKFEDPFNYQMEILQQNERKLQPVDLATTFNFLLGIDVDRIKTEEHQNRTYRIITGQRKEQGYFIVWRKYDDSLKLDEERDWIKKLDYYDENYKKYCNADNSFGAESTENEFKRLMFEDVN